jgi:hypothetical protein
VVATLGVAGWLGAERVGDWLFTLGLWGEPRPVEDAPYARLLSRAQEQMAERQLEPALASFELAFAAGETKVARSLRNQAQVAQESWGENACAVTGFGHPRPYAGGAESSRPTLALSERGLLVTAWAAKYDEGTQRAVFATQLDEELRRVSAARIVTPEPLSADTPQLARAGSGHVLVYTELNGKQSLVRARRLGSRGQPRGKSVLVSSDQAQFAYDPAVAAAEDGSLWIAYTQATDPSVHDLYIRHFDRALAPLSEPVQLTAFGTNAKARSAPELASLAVQRGIIALVFVTQRGKEHQVHQLVMAEDGVGKQPLRPAGTDSEDRVAGTLLELSPRADAMVEPKLACNSSGCFAAWADEESGAHAAFTGKEGRELTWKRAFAAAGQRPAVAAIEGRAAVAWYEGNRVRLAQLTESGVGAITVVGRVSGLQPAPVVVAGPEPGRWYIAWRSYEATVPEPFVARVDCN